MAGKLKIADIAQQTGLSISTVSRVLAGKSNTSPRAKALVLECARSQGALAGRTAGHPLFNQLMVFAPSRAFDKQADVFYYRMIQGIRQAVDPYDVHLSYCALEENDSDVQLFLKRMSEPMNEAAIIIGVDDPMVHEIAADLKKPCVLMNSRDLSMRLDTVLPDHRQLGEFSANYLIQQGHRKILTVMCLRRFTLERRLEGIKDAYLAHNIPFQEDRHLIETSGFSAAEAEQAMLAYLEETPAREYPTAILVGGDFMATGVIKALQSKGCSVPRDFSIMSVDGFNLATIGDIPLTSVHVPREELGVEALGLLQRRITRPNAPACNLLVGGELATGSSVRRIGRSAKTALSSKDYGLYSS